LNGKRIGILALTPFKNLYASYSVAKAAWKFIRVMPSIVFWLGAPLQKSGSTQRSSEYSTSGFRLSTKSCGSIFRRLVERRRPSIEFQLMMRGAVSAIFSVPRGAGSSSSWM
jgi:hypothetical protein